MSRLFIAGMLFLVLCFMSASLGAFLYLEHHDIVLDENVLTFEDVPSYVIYFKAHVWFFFLTTFAFIASFVVEYFDFKKAH